MTQREQERKTTENVYDAIGKSKLRFLRVGESRKRDERFVEAVTPHNTTVPTLHLFGKVHKERDPDRDGPKRRSVVSATEGPEARVANMTANALNQVADIEASKTECISTEDLPADVEN